MSTRLTMIAILLCGLAVTPSAHARCAESGGALRNWARVDATKVEGAGPEAVTVTIVADTVEVCQDGVSTATGPLGARTTLSVEGETDACTAQTTSDWDPFGFGAGVHDDVEANHECSADISWGGFTNVYAPDPEQIGPNESGAGAYVGKNATVENGIVFLHETEYRAHGIGRMYTGAGIDS